MIFDNPHYKRIKGSYILIVRCNYCKTDIAKYQKVGKGRLLRMYIERIVESSVNIAQKPGALFCPNCKQQLAIRAFLKGKNTEAYVLNRSAFNVIKK